MESVCLTCRHPTPFALPFSSRPIFFLKPFKSLLLFKPLHSSPKSETRTLTPLRASSKSPDLPSPPPNETLKSFQSLLKPALAAAALAAAAFVARCHNPFPAFARISPPAAQSSTLTHEDSREETLTDAEKEKTLEARLQSDPTSIPTLRSLMELKVKRGNLPEAISLVDRLILVDPAATPDLPLLKAHLQTYSGDSRSANLGFEDIISKDPFVVEAYHGLVMSASQGEEGDLNAIMKRVETVMEMCEKEERREELRDFKLLVAQVRVIEGEYEEALKVYEELVREEPRDFRPYLCQGIIYTLMRKQDMAEKQFDKYQKLVPKGHPYAQLFERNLSDIQGFLPK